MDDVGIFTETVEVAQTTGKTHVIDRSPFFFVEPFAAGMDQRKGRNVRRERENEKLTGTFCRLFNEIPERFDRQQKERDGERKRANGEQLCFRWTRVSRLSV